MTLERRYLLNREVQSSDAATRIVQLPRQGLLSAIGLRVEITNGATRGTERIHDAIDRVEVIANGSEVLFSLEGTELYKWQFVHLRRRPPQVLTQAVSGVQELFLIVPFGRKLGDPEYCLDLSQFQSVELRIQYSPTIGATTFATGTTTFSAILYMWGAGLSPVGRRGYIRTTQFRSFTTAASGEDVTEMPRRFPILDVLVYCREAAIADGVDISLAEIREDDGRVIPYTGRFSDIQAENQQMLDMESEEWGIALRTDNDTIDTLLSRISTHSLAVIEDGTSTDSIVPQVTVASIAADRLTLSVVETDEDGTQAASAVATADYTIHWWARGIGIGNAIFIPLWDLEHPESAYPAPSKSKVTLALTQAGAGGDTRASVRELVAA